MGQLGDHYAGKAQVMSIGFCGHNFKDMST